ncbi:MAG: bi-domain-containing oxidoreductase [Legionella sp.]|nr:bi-domain-containing oxidoreductase [Legionella sp.]
MKQILQNMKNGTTELVVSPAPACASEHVLIQTTCSLISVGTERMLVDFGRASYFEKARQQPEKVKMVLDKVKTDGLIATIDAVRSKLAQPIPLGYCNVGRVHEAGKNATRFKVGARVISNGPHADVVKVAKNLCAPIPDEVDDESAAFTVLASIGLQGIRLAQPTLGESFVVIGVGLIGLLTIQLLKAHGCRVLAIDFDEKKLALAQRFGANICNLAQKEDPVAAGMTFSRGYGVDGVIITAATKSNAPIQQAAHMSRSRGRIILVGVTGLELNRADFYEKELSFQVSCSYGPGRYEPAYEEKGLDYPIGFVRWTEQRNFEAVLDMMACGQLNVQPLITHRYLFDEAEKAYQTLTNDSSALGILLHYTSESRERLIKTVPLNVNEERVFNPTKPVIGVIGAGNYAARVLIPAFKKAKAQLHTILTASGVSGVVQGRNAQFVTASTDEAHLFSNPDINTVVIATRHDSHADFVVKALKTHKHVFVEKPLAINLAELSEIETTYQAVAASGFTPYLMVGFNRRFSPHIKKMKQLLQVVQEPKNFIMTVNAGDIPSTHWAQDNEIGGGRIIGEACHFIDLMRFLADSKIVSVQARKTINREDVAVVIIGFEDGSWGTIHYMANGSSRFPKERIEVFTAGRVLQLDNFRKLSGFGWPGFKKLALWKQDKGQDACCAAFLNAIEGGESMPIPFNEMIEVARVTIEAAQLLREQ